MSGKTDTFFFEGRVRIIFSPKIKDERGCLIPFYFEKLPFIPCRSFVVTGTPEGAIRGQHAHQSGKQLLICLNGKIEMLMRYKKEEIHQTLDDPGVGIILEAGVWCQQTYIKKNSILLVFASQAYDPDLYIDQVEI